MLLACEFYLVNVDAEGLVPSVSSRTLTDMTQTHPQRK